MCGQLADEILSRDCDFWTWGDFFVVFFLRFFSILSRTPRIVEIAFVCLLSSTWGWAQTSSPMDSTTIRSQGHPIEEEVEGLLVVQAPPKQFRFKDPVLFIRLAGEDFEILGQGEVQALQDGKVYIDFRGSRILKRPLKGDFVIPMAQGWKAKPEESDPNRPNFLLAQSEGLPDEPGYIQLDMGPYHGALASSQENQANYYKQISEFEFQRIHFRWFVGFIWRLGIDYESYQGLFPTSTYYRESFKSQQNLSRFTLLYRFRAFGAVRFTPHVMSFSDDFTTSNPDEYLISSRYSGIGFGSTIAYEWAPPTWKGSGLLDFQFQSLSLVATVYPTLQAQDTGLSRGTASDGSTGLEWQVRMEALVSTHLLPYSNRFLLAFSYGNLTYNLRFSGATKGESGGYVIPENGRYSESNTGWHLQLGVRWDDIISEFLRPK